MKIQKSGNEIREAIKDLIKREAADDIKAISITMIDGKGIAHNYRYDGNKFMVLAGAIQASLFDGYIEAYKVEKRENKIKGAGR